MGDGIGLAAEGEVGVMGVMDVRGKLALRWEKGKREDEEEEEGGWPSGGEESEGGEEAGEGVFRMGKAEDRNERESERRLFCNGAYRNVRGNKGIQRVSAFCV